MTSTSQRRCAPPLRLVLCVVLRLAEDSRGLLPRRHLRRFSGIFPHVADREPLGLDLLLHFLLSHLEYIRFRPTRPSFLMANCSPRYLTPQAWPQLARLAAPSALLQRLPCQRIRSVPRPTVAQNGQPARPTIYSAFGGTIEPRGDSLGPCQNLLHQPRIRLYEKLHLLYSHSTDRTIAPAHFGSVCGLHVFLRLHRPREARRTSTGSTGESRGPAGRSTGESTGPAGRSAGRPGSNPGPQRGAIGEGSAYRCLFPRRDG